MNFNKAQTIALGLVFGALLSAGILTVTGQASARSATTPVTVKDEIKPANGELIVLAGDFRMLPVQAPTDQKMVARAEAAAERVYELYRQNALRSGEDYLNAALILGHTNRPKAILLASELAMAGLAAGAPKAGPIAAWTHDRFLQSIGKNQQFGTLFAGKGISRKVLPIDQAVTDLHRVAMGLPSLADAIQGKGIAIARRGTTAMLAE